MFIVSFFIVLFFQILALFKVLILSVVVCCVCSLPDLCRILDDTFGSLMPRLFGQFAIVICVIKDIPTKLACAFITPNLTLC